ncbi:MAG: YggS family pyridoxal phosphate-dependent enzyme [bacterium]
MDIARNFKNVLEDLPRGVKIVAVSKTRSPAEIMHLYSTGHRIMGENKVQEMVDKKDDLPDDIQWHMIGHLQSNKVKYIAPFVSMIHSADSLKILKIINKEAKKNNRIIDCLLQVHIAREESKFGFSEEEVLDLLGNISPGDLPGVRIRGLMGMATLTVDSELIRSEFRNLSNLFKRIKESVFAATDQFDELSMGMSNDYKIAMEEGSTIVRIGSLIFGERNT